MITRLWARVWGFLQGVGGYAKRHKIQAGIVLVLIALLGWWGYSSYQKNATTTQYVLAFARMAPIEETVTGSGQVASEHQLNLAPKASGVLTSVRVKAGDQVTAGEVIATVDSTDAQKSLRDAATNLESARISYLQSQSSNVNSVEKSRDAAFTSDTTAFADMNTALAGMDDIMQGNEVSGSFALKNVYAYAKLFNDNASVVSERDRAITAYNTAKNAYQSAQSDYNATTRTSDPAHVADLTKETYTALVSAAEAAKSLNDYLNDVHSRLVSGDQPQPVVLSSHLTSAASYVSDLNGDVTATLSAENDLSSAIATSGSGGQTLSQESASLSYQKAQNAYRDAQDTLANYMVIAPFPGTIASVPLQKFDNAGSGTTVAILTTKEQIATLSLNEVDAAKVKAGQPATLTFDAIDGLTIKGTVAEVDTVGTVSQGVVSYTVKIGFDDQDARVLPGMTVNATIVTASKDSALVVPSSAVKTTNGQSYIEVADYTSQGAQAEGMGTTTRQAGSGGQFRRASTTGAFASSTRIGTATGTFAARTGGIGLTVDADKVTTHRVPVTIGIVGDTTSEITSGITAGEFVVSQSLNASGKTTAQTPSLFNLFGGPRGGAAGAARSGTAGAGVRTGGNATFVARPAGGG